MRVLIFEDNLMWSSRLLKSLTALGHESVVVRELPPNASEFDVAIVNLGSMPVQELVPRLKQAGLRVIGHAGHKEKDLHALGREIGCDRLATNSELTFKLENLLKGG